MLNFFEIIFAKLLRSRYAKPSSVMPQGVEHLPIIPATTAVPAGNGFPGYSHRASTNIEFSSCRFRVSNGGRLALSGS
jgi:hypothetical protein